jgi:hypothetical protein
LANPITWIVIGIVALIAGLVILEVKFGLVSKALSWVWDKMKQFASWLMRNKKIFLNLIPGMGLLKAGAWGLKKLGIDVPMLAQGGRITMGGWAVVGERGPELARMPSGAEVRPLDKVPSDLDGRLQLVSKTVSPVVIDGREIAEIVFEHRLERYAR